MFLGSDSFLYEWKPVQIPVLTAQTDYTADQKERKAPSMNFNFVSDLMYVAEIKEISSALSCGK